MKEIKNNKIKKQHLDQFINDLIKKSPTTVMLDTRGNITYMVYKILLEKYKKEFKLWSQVPIKECIGNFNLSTLQYMYRLVCNKTSDELGANKEPYCANIQKCSDMSNGSYK